LKINLKKIILKKLSPETTKKNGADPKSHTVGKIIIHLNMKINIAILMISILTISCGKKENSDQSTTDTSVSVQKVTFSEAETFMQERCNTINQTLMKKKTVTFNGTKLYMFMSVAEDGQACISSISENKLEVLAADCGEVYMKIEQWNNVN
jgi:hypothetical protein